MPLDALLLASPEFDDEIVEGANVVFKVNSSPNVDGVIGIGGAECSNAEVDSEVVFKKEKISSFQKVNS